ncbi:MAG: von Willebrand factor type A domain-containing protein [Thermoguttaceae bacterium]|nr:von Willebrand factor type A domain-containing protein [Thermoguttaceae bacterium]
MIKLNDPRITAYLLGELAPEEVEIIEQALRSSPTLAKNVEQMRQTIELLKLALPEDNLDFASQTSEQTSDNKPADGFQSAASKESGHWQKFFWKAAVVLAVGLGLYLLCLPKSAPIQTPDDSPSSPLSSQTTVSDDDHDPNITFAPISAAPSQASVDKTWEEYGLTSQQVELLNQQPETSNSNELDVVALFPQDAVNRTQRMASHLELLDSDGWQYKTYSPQKTSSATELGTAFSDKLIIENPVEYVSVKPKSSFGLVPETVSWKILQQSVKDSGTLPSSQTVRVEQYVNHFRYSLPKPQKDAFSLSVQIGKHPWTPGLLLALVGVRSQDEADGKIIASDAAIEIVFNPEQVKAYRLIGWAKRLTDEESTPYKPIQSAQVAANSEVVALYELALTENSSEVKPGANLFTATIAYSKPDTDSEPQTETLVADMPTQERLEQTNKDPDFRFAAGAALFAQIVQNSEYSGTGNLDAVLQLLKDSVGDDPQRQEFLELTTRIKQEVIKQNGVTKLNALPSESKP